MSHLSLCSVEHGYSGAIFIEKEIDGKSFLIQDLKIPNVDLDKWGVGSISEDSWQQLLLTQHLKETKCIQWHFFVPEDPGYQTMKNFFSVRFHEVPIDATLYYVRNQDGHQISRKVKAFAVPFVNQECIASDRTFRFQ